MDGPIAEAYKQASNFFVDAVQLIPDTKWNMPGLGIWTMRELVGHGNRAHTNVEEYLLRPRPPEPKESTYFSEDSIAQRGRDASLALGDDPKRAVKAAARRVGELIDKSPGDATIETPVATMPLAGYLSRLTAELTIHGLDIIRAIDEQLAVPPMAIRASLAFVVSWSADNGEGEIVLRALSGRGDLPAKYSVY